MIDTKMVINVNVRGEENCSISQPRPIRTSTTAAASTSTDPSRAQPERCGSGAALSGKGASSVSTTATVPGSLLDIPRRDVWRNQATPRASNDLVRHFPSFPRLPRQRRAGAASMKGDDRADTATRGSLLRSGFGYPLPEA